VSKKSDQVVKVLDRIKPRWALPTAVASLNLLEHGMIAVLLRHLDQRKAESALSKLKQAYPEWNEMRVAQAQEIAGHMLGLGRRPARADVEAYLPAARDAREYLQEVFQKTHGLELEFLREDLGASAKLMQQMPHLGLAAGGYLLWLAGEKQLPVHAAMVRVLDRLGLVSRAGLAKKARETVGQLVPQGSELRFLQIVGEIADRWCDPRKPICWECPLREDCPFGKKVAHDHRLQMERLEAQRKRDEAKRAVLEKKEAEKRRREEERLAKRAAVESAKQERIRARQAAADAKKRALEDAKQKKLAEIAKKKALAEKAKADAARKAAQKAKAASKKKPGKKR
jgi:endonuclease III